MKHVRQHDEAVEAGDHLLAERLSAGTRSLGGSVLRAGVVASVVSMVVSGVAYAAVVGSQPQAPVGVAGQAAFVMPAVGEPGAAEPVSFTLTVDGQSSVASASGESWGAVLLEAGVVVDTVAGDTVSVALDAVPVAGAEVVVEHVSVSSQVQEDLEPHGTVEEDSADLDKGERKVKTEGVDGVTRSTYTVRSVGGQEVSRELTSQVVVSGKVDEVVLVGTREKEEEPAPKQEAPKQQSSSSSSGEGSGSSGGSAPANPAPSGTSAGDAQATAKALVHARGWGDGEFSCLVTLWNRESGWNYRAQNPYSGAYGIPQALPGSKMASAGSDWRTNPTTQIQWGLGYIAGRYGTPCAALGHSNRVGWY